MYSAIEFFSSGLAHRARMSDQLLCDMMCAKCNWTYWSLHRQWIQRTDR